MRKIVGISRKFCVTLVACNKFYGIFVRINVYRKPNEEEKKKLILKIDVSIAVVVATDCTSAEAML